MSTEEKMEGVRGSESPVYLYQTVLGRYQARMYFKDGDLNVNIDIDILDQVEWLREHKPELLKEQP